LHSGRLRVDNAAMSLSHRDLASLDEIAEQIAALIEPVASFRADFARDFARTVRRQPERAWELYTSHAWWGGPGSMADFQFSIPSQNRAYIALLAQLVRLFQSAGYEYERANTWAEVFQGWARDGVYG
jgi:hypothetical protein